MIRFLCSALLFFQLSVEGRNISFRVKISDPGRKHAMVETDVFKFTEMPSTMPSDAPTLVPSVSPTDSPSVTSSENPTSFPTGTPTSPYEKGVRVGGPGYFNYNPDDLEYGPKAWGSVHNTPEFYSWAKWPRDVWGFELNNQCDRNWRPSPIDVCDGVGDGTNLAKSVGMNNVNSPCHEYHRILTQGRDWRIDDDSRIKKLILPSKLRLEYALRDCPYQTGLGVKAGGSPVWFPLPPEKGGKHKWCDWEPPAADYPNHWNGHIQPIHIDVKIPSEHTICGKRYDGEFTVWHIHPQRQAAVTMSTLIEVGQHNSEMQKAIDQWQLKFNKDRLACFRFRERKLREENSLVKRMDNYLQTGIDHEDVTPFDRNLKKARGKVEDDDEEEEGEDVQSTWLDLPDETVDTGGAEELLNDDEVIPDGIENQTNETEASQKSRRRGTIHFNPYHPLIYRSVWFYGYWGTMTEPPCSDRFISWRIMDAPMQISKSQLDQLKNILFNYVGKQCERQTAHHNGSVARPTQPFNNRNLWRCNRDRWEHDFEAWRCLGHEGSQFGCKREQQTSISPPPTFSPTDRHAFM